MSWSTHGWWIGRGMQPRLARRRLDCGGPHLCIECALEAQRADAETARRPQVPLSPVPRPEDIATTREMLAVLGRFGQRLSRVCFAAVAELERLAPAATEDDVAQQRADDDGWPPPE